MASGTFSWPQPTAALESSLREVDELMFEAVGKRRLGKAAARLITAGGKRLRPALTITCAAINDRAVTDKALRAAAAVELIHLASLVHDDILDASSQRRQKPSANVAYGPGFAVLLGDYLIAKGLSQAAAADQKIIDLLTSTVAEMAEGEAAYSQSSTKKIQPLSSEYFELISQKTAGLFATAAVSGAICGGAENEEIEALRLFGREFGTVFQLIDDLADGRIKTAQKSTAIAEIKRRNKAAAENVSRFSGEAVDSLRQLPTAYLNWAYPL